ncbi:MAG TPA: sulfite exporter TauE/SafE family protein [Bryobacteraceae bacterium]|nr:sulfite exporter TauE/SafE family protein [Bryobacteraceae bacterium]
MHFPVSGVACPLWLPPAAAFLVALLTAPAGLSGAFLLLPFQMSVLGFVSPAVTPTNLIYNVVATPGGIVRYIQERRMEWRLALAILAGTLPGVALGAVVRIRYLPDPRYAKLFVGCVLLYLGVRLLLHSLRAAAGKRPETTSFNPALLAAVALPVGVIGGIYGVGGGAIIAPFAMTILRLPARMVAGAAMVGTLVTSIMGVATFEMLSRMPLSAGASVQPDWMLGLLFGVGGLAGSYFGARLQKHLPERWIRLVLGLLITALALTYVIRFLLTSRVML